MDFAIKHIILWDYLELAMTPFSMDKCTKDFWINLIYHLETYKFKQWLHIVWLILAMNPLIDVSCSLNLKFIIPCFSIAMFLLKVSCPQSIVQGHPIVL
jgi:hypothetical protein